jgi:hypothetical protein
MSGTIAQYVLYIARQARLCGLTPAPPGSEKDGH